MWVLVNGWCNGQALSVDDFDFQVWLILHDHVITIGRWAGCKKLVVVMMMPGHESDGKFKHNALVNCIHHDCSRSKMTESFKHWIRQRIAVKTSKKNDDERPKVGFSCWRTNVLRCCPGGMNFWPLRQSIWSNAGFITTGLLTGVRYSQAIVASFILLIYIRRETSSLLLRSVPMINWHTGTANYVFDSINGYLKPSTTDISSVVPIVIRKINKIHKIRKLLG
jgi:hypothetical protein